ncbi:sperm microtubule inner protein 11 [Carettochelys insculpta]|uniref:sperm microtubule inner protein 11 n=1 Tax=Carettochelys insculpta TaxID=44489 RepID=UPI003EBC6419
MAFFGLTSLGYQEPLRERTLECEKPDADGLKPRQGGLFHPKLPPIGLGRLDSTVHQGSYARYREAVKRNQFQRSPNQIFRVPVTCAQDCGWWLPRDPAIRAAQATPWMTTQRHPLIRSPMTRFVDSMGLSHPYFSLF